MQRDRGGNRRFRAARLDAQFFGLAQRRKRVFLVCHSGNWRCAAAALQERESLCGRAETGRPAPQDVSGTLSARTSGGGGLGLDFELDGGLVVTHTLRAEGFDASEDGTGRGAPLVEHGLEVRQLTPRECERLQGFPDDFTLVPLPLKGRQARQRWASDSARYRALGNSMAAPVVRWIGKRIAQVDAIMRAAA